MAHSSDIAETVILTKRWNAIFDEKHGLSVDKGEVIAKVMNALSADNDSKLFKGLVDDLINLLFFSLPKTFALLEQFSAEMDDTVALCSSDGYGSREAAKEFMSTFIKSVTALQCRESGDSVLLRLRSIICFSRMSYFPCVAWLSIFKTWLRSLLQSDFKVSVTEAVTLQPQWRKQNEDEGWREFLNELLQFNHLETSFIVETLKEAVLGPSCNIRLLLCLVALLTLRRQGAATAVRGFIKERLGPALDVGDMNVACRAILIAREMGLEAAARQPQFAAMSYADWWQCGPAAGQSTSSVRAFRNLLKLLWEWLPFEAEAILLRPQVQHPPSLPRDQRSVSTSADARAYQDAARGRLLEIKKADNSRKTLMM